MSPRTPDQFKEIRTEKIKLISEAALSLFADKGYANTSISMIAKKAGISKGLLYNYFESKDDLLESILSYGFDEIIEIYDLNKDGELEIHEMEYFIREIFNRIKTNTNFWKLYFQVSVQPDVIDKLQVKMKEMIVTFMHSLMKYFQNMGFKHPQVEAVMFGSLLDGVTFNYVLNPTMFPIDEIVEEIIQKYCKKPVS
ncbi:TetR/AcrR family transcriptional regulator [Saccharicrinis sp. FJH2]|uniref:TetR/AcrR family transcriptional regulator n=1 Tax=Saccharicrinis sp. FJH65 TaxID=3344659 RepID=UPI0035F2D2A5